MNDGAMSGRFAEPRARARRQSEVELKHERALSCLRDRHSYVISRRREQKAKKMGIKELQYETYGLSTEVVRETIDSVLRHSDPDRIILYGSRGRGDFAE